MATMAGTYGTRTYDDVRRMRGDAVIYNRLPAFRRHAGTFYYWSLAFAVLVMLCMGGWGLGRCIANTRATENANAQMWEWTDQLRLISLLP